MSRFGKTPIIIMASLVGIGLLALWFTRPQNTDEQNTNAAPPPPIMQDVADKNAAPVDEGVAEIVLGAADAPITIIEYSSLTCGHCGAFHAYTLPQLKEKYVDTGLVQFQFRPFPFDPYAMAAAMLVYCVPPPHRVALLDVLFLRQSGWAATPEPMENLQKLVRQAGLSEEDFVVCLKDETILAGIRDVQRDAAENLGVRSTPTFFINGRKLEGNHPLSEFEKYIKPLLPEGNK